MDINKKVNVIFNVVSSLLILIFCFTNCFGYDLSCSWTPYGNVEIMEDVSLITAFELNGNQLSFIHFPIGVLVILMSIGIIICSILSYVKRYNFRSVIIVYSAIGLLSIFELYITFDTYLYTVGPALFIILILYALLLIYNFIYSFALNKKRNKELA